MNSQTAAIDVPTLPAHTGEWRAVYWEPVMQTGERICVGFLTLWDQQARAVLTLRPDLLATLFGAAGQKVQVLLDRGFRLMNAQLGGHRSLAEAIPPMSGLFFGEAEVCHVNAYVELLQIAKLMSSSLSTLAEPDNPDIADEVDDRPEQAQPARQFVTRVRDLAVKRDVRVASCFNKDVALKSSRRLTRFGFMSDSLVAHFGLLQPTSNIRNSVRMTRGLITELTLAQRASDRQSLLILGFPPLASPTLSDKERDAIQDYKEELALEAQEFDVRFAGVDNDTAACDALMAAL
jgi:hypothetical protein